MATSVSHASDALVLGVPWTALLTRSLSGTVGAESIPPHVHLGVHSLGAGGWGGRREEAMRKNCQNSGRRKRA